MIGPEDERPKEGSAQDAVTVDLCDLERGACALLRMIRVPGEADSALALVCLGGATVATLDDPGAIRLETVEPLARWTCRLEGDAVSLAVDVHAISPPIDFGEMGGVNRSEQLCRVQGALQVDGRRIEIDGVGRTAHAWGDPAAARFRSVYAIAGDRAVTVSAVRPRASDEHGTELVAAFLVRPESEPERFEDARLSTVYDNTGRPRTAGLELLLPGDEFPRRVSGEAVCRTAGGKEPLEAACFRWSMDGDPAQGGYHVGPAA